MSTLSEMSTINEHLSMVSDELSVGAEKIRRIDFIIWVYTDLLYLL